MQSCRVSGMTRCNMSRKTLGPREELTRPDVRPVQSACNTAYKVFDRCAMCRTTPATAACSCCRTWTSSRTACRTISQRTTSASSTVRLLKMCCEANVAGPNGPVQTLMRQPARVLLNANPQWSSPTIDDSFRTLIERGLSLALHASHLAHQPCTFYLQTIPNGILLDPTNLASILH